MVSVITLDSDRIIFNGHTEGFWQLKSVDTPLAEYIPLNHLEREEIGDAEQDLVNKLFDFPSLNSYLFPPILRVQIVQFQDGCVMQFILQHAFVTEQVISHTNIYLFCAQARDYII